MTEKEETALEKLASTDWRKRHESLNEVIKLVGREKTISKRVASDLVKAQEDELQRREQFFLQGRMAEKTDERVKSQLIELSKPQIREDIREEAKRILRNAPE